MARFPLNRPAHVFSSETRAQNCAQPVSRRAVFLLFAAVAGGEYHVPGLTDGRPNPLTGPLSLTGNDAETHRTAVATPAPESANISENEATTPSATTPEKITFGRVPYPSVTDRFIPDENNHNWDNAGPRRIAGVVFHRAEGTAWGTEQFLRSPQSSGLVDYMVESISGQTECWNDPLGREDRTLGVSPHRASWANGPVREPSGDARKFLDDTGWDLNVINRDQVSIQISGRYDDELGDACKQSLAALTAFFADQFHVPYFSFPMVFGKPYSFIRWHDQINANTICPGPAVKNASDEIIGRARAILWHYQRGR
jgi:hypothetical protein